MCVRSDKRACSQFFIGRAPQGEPNTDHKPPRQRIPDTTHQLDQVSSPISGN